MSLTSSWKKIQLKIEIDLLTPIHSDPIFASTRFYLERDNLLPFLFIESSNKLKNEVPDSPYLKLTLILT